MANQVQWSVKKVMSLIWKIVFVTLIDLELLSNMQAVECRCNFLSAVQEKEFFANLNSLMVISALAGENLYFLVGTYKITM